MKTRYGVSPWVHQFPDSRRPALPTLRGDHSADVVIIGGGLTGCATAYACAAAGVKTILLEADRIGTGTAGHSGGLLLPDPGPMFRDVAKAHGLRSARFIFQSWRKASLDAAALIRRLKIRCDLEPLSTLLVARHDQSAALRRELDARVEGGLDATWLGARQVAALTQGDPEGAVRHRDSFAVDPYRLVLGLATAARGRGARLFERSRATKVTFNRKDAEVRTAEATIRTRRVIVTTGVATVEYTQLRRHFTPREAYLVLTEPLPAVVRRQLFAADVTLADLHTPPRRLRWVDGNRVLIAGADQDAVPDRQRNAVRLQRTGQLMYELLTLYPAISGVQPEYGWELRYGQTADGLIYIGPHRNYPHHLFALGGATGSITGAFLAARIAARWMLDASEKQDDVFGFTR